MPIMGSSSGSGSCIGSSSERGLEQREEKDGVGVTLQTSANLSPAGSPRLASCARVVCARFFLGDCDLALARALGAFGLAEAAASMPASALKTPMNRDNAVNVAGLACPTMAFRDTQRSVLITQLQGRTGWHGYDKSHASALCTKSR